MRLFAGIALDDTTRAACAAVSARLEAAGFAARYESAENLHITLAFLGNVDADRFDVVANALAQAAADAAPFAMTLDKLGAFPHERRPRIIYIGARDQGVAFRNLALDLRARYEKIGFTFNDDAVAHVTIARAKGGSIHPLPLLDVTPIAVDVAEICLFESLRIAGTTRYDVRHKVALS